MKNSFLTLILVLASVVLLAQKKERCLVTIIQEYPIEYLADPNLGFIFDPFGIQSKYKRTIVSWDSTFQIPNFEIKARKGPLQIFWPSEYGDTLFINLNITGDTTIVVKDFGADTFYRYDSTLTLSELKEGDQGFIWLEYCPAACCGVVGDGPSLTFPFKILQQKLTWRKIRGYSPSFKQLKKLSAEEMQTDMEKFNRLLEISQPYEKKPGPYVMYVFLNKRYRKVTEKMDTHAEAFQLFYELYRRYGY